MAFPSLALSQSSPSRVTPAGSVPTWPHRGVRRAPPRVVQASGEAWRSRPFTRARVSGEGAPRSLGACGGRRRDSPPHGPRRGPRQSREGRCTVGSGSGRPSLVPDRRMRCRRHAHPSVGTPAPGTPSPALLEPCAALGPARLRLPLPGVTEGRADRDRHEQRGDGPFSVAATAAHGAMGPAALAPRRPHGASECTSPSVEG